MELDIDNFKERLQKQVANGRSGAQYIGEEVHKAENLKVGLTEEMDHAADFVTEASNKIDTYVLHLHELAKAYPLSDFDLDQRTALKDDAIQTEIKKQVQKLEEETDNTAEDRISPLDLS
ncbi:hypothetical protein [Rufibacter sp. LB8]|uniref:hypothetical protein n=1 Tax=Rufibacter sp. LB8 TaxID=2777781 RepID=UPI00178C66EA|nr:hypothetical protein [Rufibacter sp. LB8]